MDDRHTLTATDNAIDRKLEQLLSVDPAPEFLARVRMQIADDEPIAARSSRALMAVVVSVLVVAVALWVRFTPNERVDVPTTAQTPELPVAEIRRAEFPAVLSGTTKPTVSHAKPDTSKSKAVQLAAESMPEVLMSPSDAAAFEQFLTSARERRFEVSADVIARLTDASPRGDLAIAPIAIDALSPIEPLVASEGAKQ